MFYRLPPNFDDFCSRFAHEEDCVRALFRARWPDGFRCPRCGHAHAYTITTRRLPLYECRSCRTQTSLIAGTVFEGSRTPLRLWFQAMFLHVSPKTVNAKQLSELLHVTYKTAWLMLHKLRHAMSRAQASEFLCGIVRISEAIYCPETAMRWKANEQPILIGSSENECGEITRIKMEKHAASTAAVPERPRWLPRRVEPPEASGFIRRHVDPASAGNVVVTGFLGKQRNRVLLRIVYEMEQHLAWVFRGIGPKHLQAYMDQYSYTWNRKGQPMFAELLGWCASTRTVTYPALTGTASRSVHRKRLRAWASGTAG